MQTFRKNFVCLGALMASLCAPVYATVNITLIKPSVASPQPIGTVITYTITATDTAANPVAFQFNVTAPGGTSMVVYDFNTGSGSSGTWTSQPMVWWPSLCTEQTQSTGVVALTCQPVEGTYEIEVTAKDFKTGQSSTKKAGFTINPIVTGTTPVVQATANPLVALFGAPACPVGSAMRVYFQEASKAVPAVTTNWVNCLASKTMNFEVAGMYPQTSYHMFAQTETGGAITKGPTMAFTTGAVPAGVQTPTIQVNVPAGTKTDTAYPYLLLNPHQYGGGPVYPNMATDLAGNIMWYYNRTPPQNLVMGRPLQNGTFLTIQSGQSWNPASGDKALLVQIDLAGNTIRETNTGIIQQQLLALGATDGGPCNTIASPAPVGSACLDDFHHDAIQTLPNGDTAVLVDIEKIFPPGTQGNTSGLPVDIIGDMVVVLDSNFQVIWYWDTFDPAGGGQGYPLMPITRTAILNETCGAGQDGCPPGFLLGTGIAPLANDWMHCNSIYYWPQDQSGVAGQLIVSSRNQDLIMKVDYENGGGTGDVLWIMGLGGNFAFNNIYNDPYPWFSGQHEVGIENNGALPMSMFDNGNTRTSAPPLGLGVNCGPYDCNSRGMALNFTESNLTVTPALSVDLGVLAFSGGNAELLADGNYYFMAATVLVSLSTEDSFALEILPTPASGLASVVLNVQTTESYRGWQLVSLYNPPIT